MLPSKYFYNAHNIFARSTNFYLLNISNMKPTKVFKNIYKNMLLFQPSLPVSTTLRCPRVHEARFIVRRYTLVHRNRHLWIIGLSLQRHLPLSILSFTCPKVKVFWMAGLWEPFMSVFSFHKFCPHSMHEKQNNILTTKAPCCCSAWFAEKSIITIV